MGESLPRVSLGGRASDIAAGFRHTCAILDNGSLKCWYVFSSAFATGASPNPQPDAPSLTLRPPAGISPSDGRIAKDSAHSARPSRLRRGANAFGGLGLGDVEARGDEPMEMGLDLPTVDLGAAAKAVSCGKDHT